MEKEKIEEVATRLEEVRHEYGVNTVEFGKILIIASTAMFVVSAHAVLTFKSASESLEDSNSELDRAYSVIDSDGFQNMLNALDSIGSSSVRNQLDTARSAFEGAGTAMESSRETEKMLENRYRTYQWVTLASILGIVAGVAVIFV